VKVSAGKWPSLGCLAVCTTYILVAAFFIWGFSTPDLDRVWTLHHQLKIGKLEKLKAADRALLEDCMARHAELARDLMDGDEIGIISAHSDGWIATPTATVLRTGKAERYRAMVLEIQTPRDLLPCHVEIRGRGWKERVEVDEQGVQEVDLPDPPKTPEVIEVRMRGQSFEPDPSVLGVRIRFKERP
jgi:hypothetical protein